VQDLGEQPDDQSVLQNAMGRETSGHDALRANLAQTAAAPGPIRDLFQYLAGEETRHRAGAGKSHYGHDIQGRAAYSII